MTTDDNRYDQALPDVHGGVTATPTNNDHDAEHCLDCNPGAAHLGEGMTLDPGKWTAIDDNGTEIYLYGDQAVDIVVKFPA